MKTKTLGSFAGTAVAASLLAVPLYCFGQVSISSGTPTSGLSNWTETEPLPAPATAVFGIQGLSMVFDRGYAYVFAGFDEEHPLSSEIYYGQIEPDGKISSWRQDMTTPNFPRHYFQQMVLKARRYFYMVTGADGSIDVLYAPIEDDGSVGPWQTTAALDPSRQHHAIATNGDYIYSIAGNSGGNTDFVAYAKVNPDGSLQPWQNTTPVPEAMQAQAATAVFQDDTLYVVMPGTGHTYFSKITADGSLSSWVQTTSVPGSPSRYALVEENGWFFVIGGPNTDIYTARITNDGPLTEWQITTPLPERREGPFAGAYRGYIYEAGGTDETGQPTDTVYVTTRSEPPQCDLNDDGVFSTRDLVSFWKICK